VIKRSAVIGIGFVFLVIGLAGLALLKTDVAYWPAFKRQLGLLDVKPPSPSQEGPGQPAGLEHRQLPEPAESIRQTPEPGSKTEQVPAPQSEGEPRTPGPAVNSGGASGAIGPRSAGIEAGEKRLTPGDLATEKAIPVPQAGKGERRYPEQVQAGRQGTAKPDLETTPNPSLDGSKARPHHSSEALQPVVIRFHFDPAKKREISVALVHLGDSISVRVRRLGLADLGLHLAFAVPDTIETDAWREWSVGSRRAAVAPIHDTDRIALTADSDFGVAVTRKLDSKEGAVLKLGADYPEGVVGPPAKLPATFGGGRTPAVQSLPPASRGGYEIQMRIYPGNRWNIMPKGLL
jgi:hypothetical protein